MSTYMTIFTCKRCGEAFKQKVHLANHLRRKFSCVPVIEELHVNDLLAELYPKNDYCCGYCEKTFASDQSLKRHQRTICRNKPTKSNPVQVTNNHITNNITNNIQINVINNFGNENVDYVMKDKVFLEKCIRNLRSSGMMNLVEKIHYCLQ